MNKTIQVTQNDIGIVFQSNIVDVSNNVVDLTGCNVNVTVVKSDQTKYSTTATIVNAVNGTISITTDENFTNIIGTTTIYIEVDNIGSITTTQNNIEYEVIAKYGGA